MAYYYVLVSWVCVYDLPGFDIEDDSSTSTTTTIGQQYHDYNKVTKEEQEVEEEHENRTRAEELLLELIELKEEGKYWVIRWWVTLLSFSA